jgi:hypothetical protein
MKRIVNVLVAHGLRAASVVGLCGLIDVSLAAGLPSFDFTQPEVGAPWGQPHHIDAITPSQDGLELSLSGHDPYLHGPAFDTPAGAPLWLHLRLRSDTGGVCQVFYLTQGASEEGSVRFPVPAREWHEARVPILGLGAGYRLRVDPPGSTGRCVLGRLWFDERVLIPAPAWPKAKPPALAAADPALRSGDVELHHSRTQPGVFEIRVGGRSMAGGWQGARVGYQAGSNVVWFDPLAEARVRIRARADTIVAHWESSDPDGARWRFEQGFVAGSQPGTIDLAASVAVDQDRLLIHVPLFGVFPGLGSFGTAKTQGLLAGIEYLDNEPSSSEADLRGPQSQRQVPARHRFTFPLAAVAARDRYIGMTWNPDDRVAACFDSPDRSFQSEAHFMGLIAPGSNSDDRFEGSLLPHGPLALRGGATIRARVSILGGMGASVTDAIQHYLRVRPLPRVPEPEITTTQFLTLAARGWLDSKIRDGDKYRHAVFATGGGQPAADAALWMDWLAAHIPEASLGSRLKQAASAALRLVDNRLLNAAGVGHVRYPAPALVYGALEENLAYSLARGRNLLERFDTNGAVPYRSTPGAVDYGVTHYAKDANGHTAQVLTSVLEDAVWTGDPHLLTEGLRRLRQLDRFTNTVPRGAQTWEIPLHTPDILAAAHLLRAYTLGFELTGDPSLLHQARHWAWTGVPFVYLVPPANGRIGRYSTTPVLGATGWTAPNWIGLPVQWCGMVYADALFRLARHDPRGPWRQLADGITTAGMQHTHPASDGELAGLLPDSFDLRIQARNPVPINPATVLAGVAYEPTLTRVYDYWSFPESGVRVHVAGTLSEARTTPEGIEFRVRVWPRQPSAVLVNGLRSKPRVLVDGEVVATTKFEASAGRVEFKLLGEHRVSISKAAR